MPDWTKPMEQSFEYYTVEPTTLADIKRLDNVKKSSFSRDSSVETLGSATIDVSDSFGESYIRCYLKTIQEGVTEKFPLGTVLSQTPSSTFNGKVMDVSMDCYTPLIELKEKQPPLGYTVRKGTRIMDAAYRIIRENARVPVSKVEPIIEKSKNLFDASKWPTKTVNGVAVTNNGDGSFTISADSGAIMGNNIIFFRNEFTHEETVKLLKPGKLYLDCVNVSSPYIYIQMRDSAKALCEVGNYSSKPGGFIEITQEMLNDPDVCFIIGLFYSPTVNTFINNTTIKPMLYQDGDGTWEPYFEPIDLSPTLQYDFVADTNDTYLSFVIALIANANYELGLGERGNVLFQPKQKLESLQPVWTYNDDDKSIIYTDITVNHDLYGIPNVVEVVYSYGTDYKQAIAINDDPNSPTSTVSRGRQIPRRITDPSLRGYVTQQQLDDYAERVLKELSTLEYTVSYKHAYCPVRIGDCVLLNYTRAGIKDIKAKVISQNIEAEPGCTVSEKAVFTSKLWR